MNNIQTGIAVTLALVVMGSFFIPGFSIFGADPLPTTDESAGVVLGAESETTESTTTNTNPNPTNTMPTSNELQISDEVVGTGVAAKAGDSLTVNYVGALADGTIFDASANHGQPFTFTIGQGKVIQGWDQGLIGMKEGGKRLLIIPAALGYGDRGSGSAIPPGATLLFQVELVKVTPAK
jgi:FKBP-type peptidyl-prolyl cis-trans isomerase